jgi:hypothetical protein
MALCLLILMGLNLPNIVNVFYKTIYLRDIVLIKKLDIPTLLSIGCFNELLKELTSLSCHFLKHFLGCGHNSITPWRLHHHFHPLILGLSSCFYFRFLSCDYWLRLDLSLRRLPFIVQALVKEISHHLPPCCELIIYRLLQCGVHYLVLFS